MVLWLIAAIFVLNAMVPTTWFNKCLASLTIDEKILSAHGNYTIWFWMTLQSKIFHDKKNCFIYTWFKVFFVFFFDKKFEENLGSIKLDIEIYSHIVLMHLYYIGKESSTHTQFYPVLIRFVLKLKMKYTVCRDLKSDLESFVERHCIRGWINNPFAKKDRTY